MDITTPARNDLIRGLLAQLEAHSPGERAHAERVAVYAVATAAKLGFTASELEMLRYAAQLHDIGKLLLPSSLLMRGEALMADERFLVERHPELARDVLKDHPWLSQAMPAITQHHERFNGMGYPYNLSGSSINLGARIIGVAEAYDVIERGVYQPAKGKEGALAVIRLSSGTDFDPAVVDALAAVVPLINPVE